MRSIFKNAFRRLAAEPSARGRYIVIGGRPNAKHFINAFRRLAAEPSARGRYVIGRKEENCE